MKILTGVDLVYLPRFKRSLKNGGENFLRRVFLDSELVKTSPEHLAGIFAAKEAVIKALDLSKDSWLDIKITYSPSGTPKIKTTNYELSLRGPATNYSLSISHDGNYVIACFVAILNEQITD